MRVCMEHQPLRARLLRYLNQGLPLLASHSFASPRGPRQAWPQSLPVPCPPTRTLRSGAPRSLTVVSPWQVEIRYSSRTIVPHRACPACIQNQAYRYSLLTHSLFLPLLIRFLYTWPMPKNRRPRKPSKKALDAAKMWQRDMFQPQPQADSPNPDSPVGPPPQRLDEARDNTYARPSPSLPPPPGPAPRFFAIPLR